MLTHKTTISIFFIHKLYTNTMLKIDKIIELGNNLPRGAKARISNKSKLSKSLVAQFFKGSKTPSLKTIKKILKATIDVIEEYKTESENINMIVNKIKL